MVDQAITAQHAEAAQRAQTREIELAIATQQATATAAQQVAATQAPVSETPAPPDI